MRNPVLNILLTFVLAASISPVPLAHAEVVTGTGIPTDITIETPGDTELVRVGFYADDPQLQDGYSDDSRKTGYAFEYLQEIAPKAGWNYEYVYGTRAAALEALAAGELDIVAGVCKSEVPDGSVLFSAMNMGLANMGLEGEERFFAVNKNRPDLLEKLDTAQAVIKAESPMYLTQLWQKYYAQVDKERTLTQGEREWLAAKGSLKVGIIDNNLPVSSVGDSGDPEGVANAVISSMQDYVGIPVEVVGYDTIREIEQAIYSGEIDAGFPFYDDPWLNEQRQLFQTDAVVSDRAMIIFKGGYREGLMDKVAISATGLGQRYYILENYPDAEIHMYANRAKCLEAVDQGEVNCIIGCSSILQRMMQEHPEYSSYSIAYLDGSESFVVVTPRNNAMLSEIVHKAALQIDQATITNNVVKSSTVRLPYTLMDVISQYALWIILFLVIVFGILLWVFVSYRRKVRAFNSEQKKSRDALEDALAAASNANNAKTMFLSNMSHDIRTPMNGIIGMTAIATANIDDHSRVKDCLAKITSSSKHLLALINEILDVSKIESGKLDLSEEPFSFPEMMEDLIVMNEPQARQKGQAFEVNVVDLAHEAVEGDMVRLQQIYTNLVSNAIKYTPEGGHITVTLAERDSGSQTIGCFDFTVADDGIGISEEYLPKIFEAFSRDSGKTVAETQGTGLGMPIALSLARMMNGDITVESKLGEGSTFTATVFLKISKADIALYDHLADLPVLVVDDDADSCTSTSLLLSDIGMNPEWTLGGREAVEMIDAREQGFDYRTGEPVDQPYFAVLLDWVMPDMDGLETIRAIRERVPREIPIVVISAHDWADIEIEARQAGAETFINKPLFKSNIALLFERILGKEEAEVINDLNVITQGASFEGRRALLAEDNDLNAEIAMEFLRMTGLEVERAENGQVALDMMDASGEGYYDCVFMDIQMPVMNGLESAAAIRQLDREDARSVPIFAMTADAFVDDIRKSREAGMDEHFIKPLEFERVVITLRKYFH